jgi:hypothetical protein
MPAECFYFCRLIPPRPSFVADMSENERTLMMAHQAYWRQKMAEGKVIVFGPVADPQGPWGLGVLKLAGEDELKMFCDGDPAIQAGIGSRLESLPMLRAVTKI